MKTNLSRIRTHLQNFDFKPLFIEELGWNNPPGKKPLVVTVENKSYSLIPLAEKFGVVVYNCQVMPDYQIRRKIEQEVVKTTHEHLIIFTDPKNTNQVWQWVRREPGQPVRYIEHNFYRNQSGTALTQRLEDLAFTLEEEESLHTLDVTRRVQRGLDVERVTKKFYDRFKTEHTAFLKFIQGIEIQADREWYASLMLNRLMFVYFIQKKGFLAGDPHYLRNRLEKVQTNYGGGRFLSFYRSFLLRLFHQGLGKADRPADFEKEMGRIPYLNGGLFEVHQLEKANSDIQIPDEAFERIFKFFDEYRWHLDERALPASDTDARKDEINPDVLGYIFEKYINQKQMGAYYTKEDITEYISKNTIIPFLFDRTKDLCEVAFRPDGPVWSLLIQDPDRYFYEAVRKGVNLELPANIAAGLDDVSKRDGWNRTAPEDYALPTEIWREVVARRKRYAEIRQKLTAGEVTSINDLITYNLDMRQFAQDVVENAEGSDLLWAFYQAIEQVTVLDPTCGSGAFLFAALNILQRLYEACLTSMQRFVDSDDRVLLQGSKKGQPAFQNFRKVLAQVAKHPNHRYFVLKSIIINNLYGVDIMEEAVEIAKLRLFLKLAAQVEPDATKSNYGLEPLPDIDFNIQAGNTLVGFATLDEARRSITGGLQGKMDFDNAGDRIEEKAKEVERGFENFRRLQTDYGIGGVEVAPALAQGKQELREKLNALRNALDRYLAAEYGIDRGHLTNKAKYEAAFQAWRESHQPFHWFVEFYRIIADGGFDVIIGNPPYVEYSKVRSSYKIKGYKTEECGNLYAFVLERSFELLNTRGKVGLIVPISSFATERMAKLKQLCSTVCCSAWISNFGIRPSKLFEGAEQRLSIFIGHLSLNSQRNVIFESKYQRWYKEERPYLLNNLGYQEIKRFSSRFGLPKITTDVEQTALAKMPMQKLETYYNEKSPIIIFWHRIPAYFIKAVDFVPYFYSDRDGEKKSEDYKVFRVKSEPDKKLIIAVLNSSTFYWFWFSISEGYHCSKHEVLEFPINFEVFSNSSKAQLRSLAVVLMEDLKKNSYRRTRNQKTTNVIYDEFYPSISKPILDQIDLILAKYYGFTEGELDFIINYDIKYRMGRDKTEGDDE